MQKLLSILLVALLLSSCSLVRKMEIEQGNVITPEMLSRVHTGMTREQVREVMGTPVLLNTFDDNRVDYIYTFKPSGGSMTKRHVTFTFRNDRLRGIEGDKPLL